eukprot:CAMPEP_0185845514 /NCGR_PEP_ID=MMETSP1354-20130828/1463_1 /TAXON_ID=708628 /ORGANISM="Erythrolobus madagascarensis, Strain CCMP3276" /LENGTH=303 /DNA_ID=CAMNT_0028545495 /DNA_START=45 /DNA_END=956 /DNA_ORIENTATION=+
MAFVTAGVAGAGAGCKSSFVCGTAAPVVVVGAGKRKYVDAAGGGAGAMQMNLFDRLSRVVRSTANNALKKVENPEKILEQSMIDMQNDLTKVRQAYAEVAATAKRLERQKEQADKTAAEWYRRAQLALQKGDEELAREALVRKTTQDEASTQLGTQLEGMRANVTKMADSVVEIESKISQARSMKDELVARARTAQTTTKVNDMLNSVGSSSGLAAFESMREKVEELEAKSEIQMQLSPGAGPGLESRFKELESGSSVDDQLEALKKSQQSLPSSSSGASSPKLPANPAVDSELEKMKREQGM